MSVGQNLPDESAVAALSDRYGLAIKRYFARRLSDRSEVEDLTQEVFVALLRRTGVQGIENIEGYIFRIASNLLRHRGRIAGRRPQIHGGEISDVTAWPIDPLSPERIMLGKEACAIFAQALQELPERARTIFTLNRFEELSGREIADRLGVSVSTVEKDMIKAIQFLRGRLA